jgi:arabinogalactan oligomer/maltooligosaccharide transport system substrate-binding protein
MKKLAPILAATLMLAPAILPGHMTPARAGGGQLLMFTTMAKSEAAVLQTEANAWGAKNGVTVKVVAQTNNFQAFATLAHTGKGPDLLVGIPDDNIGTFQLGGLLSPVPAGQFKPSDYVPGAVAAVNFGGQAFAVPFGLDTYALVYNKALVPTPPKTMENLVSVAAKFPNTKGKNYGFLFDPSNLYFGYAYIRAEGGYIFKQNGTNVDTTNIGLATPGAVKAYTFFQSLVQKKIIPPDIQASANAGVVQGLFQKGQLGMWIDGDWDLLANAKALGKNFAAAPLPTLDGNTPHPFAGVQVGFVSAFSHNQALAWQLMKYLQPIFPLADYQTAGRIPSRVADLNLKALKNDPIISAFINSALNGDPLPNVPQMGQVWTPAANNVVLVLTGKETPSAAATTMVSQIKKAIAQLGG